MAFALSVPTPSYARDFSLGSGPSFPAGYRACSITSKTGSNETLPQPLVRLQLQCLVGAQNTLADGWKGSVAKPNDETPSYSSQGAATMPTLEMRKRLRGVNNLPEVAEPLRTGLAERKSWADPRNLLVQILPHTAGSLKPTVIPPHTPAEG